MRGPRALLLGGLLGGLLLAVTACGGDEKSAPAADRPSVEALTQTLLAVGDDPESRYTPAEADCIARILVDSDLSDQALEGIAAGVPGFEKSEQDDARYRALVPKISACLVGSLPAPTQSG